MKKQILVLSIALGAACTLTAQTTQPTDKQQKGTQQKGTDQTEPRKNTNQQKSNQQKSTDQNGTQKGTQNNQPGQKGMRQSGTEDTEWNSGGVTPPSTISDKFNTENPDMNANWHMDGDNYSAEYIDKNTNMRRNVVYDNNGGIIRTDNEMNADGLNYPPGIGDYHNKNFPNEGYKVWSTDDGKGNKWFYTKRKNGTTWFDKDGKYYPGKQGKSDMKMEDKTKTK